MISPNKQKYNCRTRDIKYNISKIFKHMEYYSAYSVALILEQNRMFCFVLEMCKKKIITIS